MKRFEKYPQEVASYTVNWQLGADKIISSQFTVPSELSIDSSSFTNNTSTAIISGGTLGESYVITNQVTTLNGLTPVQTFVILIRETGYQVSIVGDTYIDKEEADEYFSTRLNTEAWEYATEQEKDRAIHMASRAINNLAYKGNKSSETQELQFPRGGDAEIPQDIKQACAELALSLLDGKDADYEFAGLSIASNKIGGVTTTSNRMLREHIVAGIVSYQSWKLLKKYMVDQNSMTIETV